MGSIGDNSSGGMLAYRASKAALNMAWRSSRIEAKPRGVACVLLQPRLGADADGRVGAESAGSAADDSVGGRCATIAALGASLPERRSSPESFARRRLRDRVADCSALRALVTGSPRDLPTRPPPL